ncbi:Protein YciI [Psilocybe cubensis]|uniref:Protein YciI n=2 Tax=Psilocybe cubensis TaxID=181762 RepID=A0ACB8HCM0_PSICU|nr:Protein YciI [Psilocybe cubensis]KAH9485231.1 Protein YciI [Psilocybe cubensis]
MSTSSSATHRFFVYAPDKTEPGTLERRLSVREKHLVGAKVSHESGFIRIGGAVTTPDAITNPDAPKNMVGSTFLFEAESIDQVKKYIENDIYYTSGVWDPEKIVILPFFSAFPLP